MGNLMYNHMCDVMKSTLKSDHVEQLALQYNESNLYNNPSQQENAFVYFRKFRKKNNLQVYFWVNLKALLHTLLTLVGPLTYFNAVIHLRDFEGA